MVELESRFTYLEMPLNSFPKYTPVFLRRTNLSEYGLINNGYLVRCSQVRKQDQGSHRSRLYTFCFASGFEGVDQEQEGNDLIYYQAPELSALKVV